MRNVKVFGLLNGNTGNCSNAFHILKESFPTRILMCEGGRVGGWDKGIFFFGIQGFKTFSLLYTFFFLRKLLEKYMKLEFHYRFMSVNHGQSLVYWKKVKHLPSLFFYSVVFPERHPSLGERVGAAKWYSELRAEINFKECSLHTCQAPDFALHAA